METIGSLLDRLQGLFSKGFLLGGFIPAFLFVFLNIGFAYWLLPILRDPINHLIDIELHHSIFFWLTGILIIFILGIAIWSLNPWFRQFMEGRHL
jgi:hypothetical protein